MFKRKEPGKPKFEIKRFPHCDSRVLHAPSECEYCDTHPDWQALRMAWGICFTGYTPDVSKNEVACPAQIARPLDTINRWAGNLASKEK